VPREVDARLEEALTFSHFVLLVGDSAAGKSRTAFEVMRRRFPDRALVIPARPNSLAALLDANIEFRSAVLWLDDLDAYLGTDTPTLTDLERIVGGGDRAVTALATIRKAAYERYDQDAAAPERKLLRTATHIAMHRPLTTVERRNAARAADKDERLRDALHQIGKYGLGEYLAAGPELIRRFDNASDIDANPIGAALVRAAIDWRRLGLTRPISAEVLRALSPLYLDPADIRRFDDNAFAQALAWATERVVATSALLIEEPEGYRVFDYLLDYAERDARFLFPVALLTRLSELVAPEEVRRVEISLRAAYQLTGQDVGIAAGRDINIVAVGDVVGRDKYIDLTPPRARLSFLPPDISYFTGREPEAREVAAALSISNVHVLTGLPGIGKTAFAIHLAHSLADRFPDGQLYVSLRDASGRAISPAVGLADLLSQLGEPSASLPDNLDARKARYRTLLTDRHMLIVLDDASGDKQQVTHLLPPATNSIIITSRTQIEGFPSTFLGGLSQNEALSLINRLFGAERVSAEPDAARRLVEFSGRLPLALRLISARLRERSTLRLADLATILQDEHARLDNLRVGDVSVRTALMTSYVGMPADLQRAFRFLGLLETSDVNQDALSRMLECPTSTAADLLSGLARNNLVSVATALGKGSNRRDYVVHDLLRLLAYELLVENESVDVRNAAIKRLQTARR
jgi:hypothetical protein